jgi:hypothetical protein
MSGYPETGNIQVLLRGSIPGSRFSFVQVEEIILCNADVYAVSEHLRCESRATELSLTIFETRKPEGTGYGLEAALVYEMAPDRSAVGHQNDIANDILTAYGSFLAPSAPWMFSPTSELHLLVASRDLIVQAELISQSSPPNEPTDGEAYVCTPEGDITVFQRGGYLRLAWTWEKPS